MWWMWLLVACQDPCEASGTTCTLVGNGQSGAIGDGGKARDAMLYYPMDVAWQPGHDAYVIVDWNNERVRRVDEDGVIDTIIGAPQPGDGNPAQGDRFGEGAPGFTVALNHPVSAEFAPDGRLYLAAWHNHKVRRWDPATGLVRVVVGNHDQDTGNNGGFDGDGGSAEEAHIWFPSSIAFEPDGAYHLVDQMNERVRRIDPDGIIDTVVGCGEHGHDDGPALLATFRFPDNPEVLQPLPGGAVEIDDEGVMWLADTWNGAIRRWELGGADVTTLPVEGLSTPTDVELGPDGRLYVADATAHQIVAIDRTTGALEVVAGTGVAGDGEDGLPATETALNRPQGIDFADDGALLIADTLNSRIRRVTP